jgi:hypothetical protein
VVDREHLDAIFPKRKEHAVGESAESRASNSRRHDTERVRTLGDPGERIVDRN